MCLNRLLAAAIVAVFASSASAQTLLDRVESALQSKPATAAPALAAPTAEAPSPYLGFVPNETITDDKGVQVNAVTKGGPADLGGLRRSLAHAPARIGARRVSPRLLGDDGEARIRRRGAGSVTSGTRRVWPRLESLALGVLWRLLAWKATDVTAATAGRSCVILAPHPDDETLGCGGLAMRKRAAGAREVPGAQAAGVNGRELAVWVFVTAVTVLLAQQAGMTPRPPVMVTGTLRTGRRRARGSAG